jgi:hypothetical protein
LKFVVFLALLSGLIACKESISDYDKLSTNDQLYIRTLSAIQCREKFAQTFKNFKDTSAKAWDLNNGYKRGNGFHQEFLEGTAALSKVDFKIWKVDSTDIYFYVTESASSVESSYFLKLSRVQNEDMITDLAEDFCTKNYTGNTSGASGPVTINQEFTRTNTVNTNHTDHYVDVYTIGFDRPAYIGPYNVTRTVTTTDRVASGGTVIGTAKSFKTTMAAQTYVFTDNAQYNTLTYYVQNFCEPVDTTGEGVFRLYKRPANSDMTATSSTIFRFGYNFTCTPTTIPAGWDLTIIF